MLAPPALISFVGRLAGVAPWIGLLGAIVWAANIYFLSSQTGLSGPPGPYIAWLSNLAHAPEYGIFAVFVFLALPCSKVHRPAGAPRNARASEIVSARFSTRRAALVVLISILYGVSDELHQSFTPGRDASVLDILTDASGAILCSAVLVSLSAPVANPRFGRVLIGGLLACVLSAWCATEVPHRFPDLSWL